MYLGQEYREVMDMPNLIDIQLLSYERFLQRRLLHPAGLYETGYILAQWNEGRLAQGYQGEERWGTVLERPMAEDGPYWVLRANGGIHSNAYDMLRWVEALRAGRVLSEESSATPFPERAQWDRYWLVDPLDGTREFVKRNGEFTVNIALIENHRPALGVVFVTKETGQHWTSLLEVQQRSGEDPEAWDGLERQVELGGGVQ